jgi:hypothetical protein
VSFGDWFGAGGGGSFRGASGICAKETAEMPDKAAAKNHTRAVGGGVIGFS